MKKALYTLFAAVLIATPIAVHAQGKGQQSWMMEDCMHKGTQMQGMHMMDDDCPMHQQMMKCMDDENCPMQDRMGYMRDMNKNMGKMMDQMHQDCNGNYDDCPMMRENMKEMQKMHESMGNMMGDRWHDNWIDKKKK